MCGRYSISVQPEELAAHFGAELPAEGLRPRLNAAPSQNLPVLLNQGERVIALLRWGLIPHWADDPAIGSKMINARAETVTEKPSFRDAFSKRRCLVLADGFYEWQQTPEGKIPVRLGLKSGAPFAMAGLWETWMSPTGESIRSFAIITTTPNALLAPIHNRMPVILPREAESLWLDNDAPCKAWLSALTPFPAELMSAVPADQRVLRDFEA